MGGSGIEASADEYMRTNMNITIARCVVSLARAAGSADSDVVRAATSSGDSNITTVDTRGAESGTLTGLVQGNGTPLANAQVRIDGTAFATNTAASGRFSLTNVPAGSGYLLQVSAAGFASKSVPEIGRAHV